LFIYNIFCLAIVCLLVTQILSQEENRRFCDRLTADCVRQQSTVGTQDDTVNIYNDHCRRTDRTWRRITRCQLVRASCLCKDFVFYILWYLNFELFLISVTMVRCDNVTCKNVAAVLRN
ncbi:hypothetical protein KR038_009444, partial [Drosophila bunnanda]